VSVYVDIPHENTLDYTNLILEHPDGTQITLVDEFTCDLSGPTVMSIRFDDSGLPHTWGCDVNEPSPEFFPVQPTEALS